MKTVKEFISDCFAFKHTNNPDIEFNFRTLTASAMTKFRGVLNAWEINNNIIFRRGGGVYGGIHVHGNAVATTFPSSGSTGSVEYVLFDEDNKSNLVTPDNANNRLVIEHNGTYFVTCSPVIDSIAGPGQYIGMSLYKGTTEIDNLHAHRTLSGGGGETGSISMSGISNIPFKSGDNITYRIWNENSTVGILITDIDLSILQVGST